jgi:hypothetical protein
MHLYIIYRITNKINSKFYIGVHKTKDINDSYMGSGVLIKQAIKKYGVENFNKEILHVFTNRKEAHKMEKLLVSESLIENQECYNLKEGGYGGFDHIQRFCKTNNHATSGRIKIFHSTTMERKTVPADSVDEYLSIGWVKGFSPEHKRKLSEGGKRKIQSPEQKLKNSQRKKYNLIYIKNNIRKWLLPEEVHDFVADGWHRFTKNCMYCNAVFEVKCIQGKFCSALCQKKSKV